LKAEASDPDGVVTQVQFWVETSFETNLLGVATRAPFTALWSFGEGATIDVHRGYWTVKAIATDDAGARSESGPVNMFYFTGVAPFPVVEMLFPKNRELVAAQAPFEFQAEQFASLGDTGPIQFFVGTNQVGSVDDGTPFSAATPPRSVIVSNLVEGEYKLTVRYGGQNGSRCISCQLATNTIRVVRLGVRTPVLTSDGQVQFEVVTSFPGRETIIQASSNLLDWLAVSTNRPCTNAFTFSEPFAANRAQRFYRVWLPWE
jgi:hypothetical protein